MDCLGPSRATGCTDDITWANLRAPRGSAPPIILENGDTTLPDKPGKDTSCLVLPIPLVYNTISHLKHWRAPLYINGDSMKAALA